MVIDHSFGPVLADLPPEPIFAIARKWRLVTRAFSVASLRIADQIVRQYLFPAEPAAVHVQIEPGTEVRNAHENSTGRLHILVSLFELASDHLTRIGPIGGDDIGSRDLELFGTRL